MPHQCTTCGHVFADGSTEMLGGCPECGNNTFQFHAGEVPDDPTEESPPEPDAGGGVASRVGRAADTVRDLVTDDGGRNPAADAPGEVGADSAGDDWPEWPDEEAAADDDSTGNDDIIEAPSDPTTAGEDRAQADARTDVVTDTDLPHGDATDADPPHGDAADAGHSDTHADAAGGADGTPSPDAPQSAEAPDEASDGPPSPEDGTVVSEPSGEEADLAALREELNDQFESIRIVEPGQYELNLMELFNRDEYIIALQEDGRYVIEVPDTWRDDETSPGDE